MKSEYQIGGELHFHVNLSIVYLPLLCQVNTYRKGKEGWIPSKRTPRLDGDVGEVSGKSTALHNLPLIKF